jgi:hypothetical protein
MSAKELLQQIETLPEDERNWLIEKLAEIVAKEDSDWAKFSAAQLASSYGPKDSIYDED